jgi:hypothetical protein
MTALRPPGISPGLMSPSLRVVRVSATYRSARPRRDACRTNLLDPGSVGEPGRRDASLYIMSIIGAEEAELHQMQARRCPATANMSPCQKDVICHVISRLT